MKSNPVHADGGSYVLTKLASEHSVLAATANSPMELVIIRPAMSMVPAAGPG